MVSQFKLLPFEIRFINCQREILYNNGSIYNGFGYYKDVNLTESNLTKFSNQKFQFLMSSTEFLIESYLVGFQFISTTSDPIKINLYSSSICSIESCSSYFSKSLLFSASKIKTWTIYPKIGENKYMVPYSFFVQFKSFFTIEVLTKTQIFSEYTDEYFYPDYEIDGRKLIPIMNRQFFFKALTSTYFYKSIIEFNASKNYDLESKIILPGTEKNSEIKKNVSIELENLDILDQNLNFKIKVFNPKSQVKVLIDYGDCRNEILNSTSEKPRSYFGLSLNLLKINEQADSFIKKINNLFKIEKKKEGKIHSFLVINSEFKFDAWLYGFKINAIENGDVLLKVIFT